MSKRRAADGGSPSQKASKKHSLSQPTLSQVPMSQVPMSQVPMSQAAKMASELTKEEQSRILGIVMRTILAYDVNKQAVPRDKITAALKDYGKAPIVTWALKEAETKFQHIFGFDLVMRECKPVQDAMPMTQSSQAAPAGASGTKRWFLVNKLDPELLAQYSSLPPTESATLGLVMTIMAIIVVNKGSISDEDLWNRLEEVDISKTEPHDDFGDVSSLVKTLCKQKYFDVVKEDGKTNYQLGQRSVLEIGYRNIKAFLVKTMEKDLDQEAEKELFGDTLDNIEPVIVGDGDDGADGAGGAGGAGAYAIIE